MEMRNSNKKKLQKYFFSVFDGSYENCHFQKSKALYSVQTFEDEVCIYAKNCGAYT